MDRKVIGMGIGAMLVISLAVVMGVVFAQEPKQVTTTGFIDANNDGVCDNAQSGNCPYGNQANGFVDANNDGICDNAANYPMHTGNGGCHGTEGCPRMKEGFRGGCHRLTAPTE
jgi:hypothetical protein